MVPFNKRRAKMLGLLEIIRDDSSIIVSLFSISNHQLMVSQAACITSEVGKTIDDAASEVTRALDMIEAACSIQNGNVGSYLADDATSTHTIHEPLVSSTVRSKRSLLNLVTGHLYDSITFQLPLISRPMVNTIRYYHREQRRLETL